MSAKEKWLHAAHKFKKYVSSPNFFFFLIRREGRSQNTLPQQEQQRNSNSAFLKHTFICLWKGLHEMLLNNETALSCSEVLFKRSSTGIISAVTDCFIQHKQA